MRISDYRCFYCFARAFEKLLEKENLSVEAKNNFTCEMAGLYGQHKENFSAPEFSRKLHTILKQYTNNPDPYKGAKRKSNDHALSLFPGLKKQIEGSANKFDTALRLAIAGNIIDFAVTDKFDLQATIDKVLHSGFSINHSRELKQAVSNADKVLYIGDNAGEIVFDKLFIETIMQFMHSDLTYVVRDAPVINDATLDDARYVGMDKIANVITNGYDGPSTILKKSSQVFKDHFKSADLIISKGQGNLEGLLPLDDQRIFFLLMVKCPVIAELLLVPVNSFVVYNPQLSDTKR